MKKIYLIVTLVDLTIGSKIFKVLSEVATCYTSDQAQTELAHWVKVNPGQLFSILKTYQHTSSFAG